MTIVLDDGVFKEAFNLIALETFGYAPSARSPYCIIDCARPFDVRISAGMLDEWSDHLNAARLAAACILDNYYLQARTEASDSTIVFCSSDERRH